MVRKSSSSQSGTRLVSATAAAKNFGALIDQVRTEGAEYVVERSGSPVARISPVSTVRCTGADLVNWLRSRARQDEVYLAAVEAGVGAMTAFPKIDGNADRFAR